ncbi:hypothetical protein [Flavobacterium sp. ABG]|uniref:hypothetical protein n=1 Tax=Flavobacterium sp. ABG TaxID=1423322 RepID=UPI00069B40B6|nr:hypothetical protein [Flavobacterium sp. ABG]
MKQTNTLQMPSFTFENNLLRLKVKKSPFVIRAILFIVAFASFIFPTTGMVISITSGHGLHFGFLIGIGIFSLLGFYLLRIALWNTYGEELILFSKEEIIYEANYGWFKDARTIIENKNINYVISPIGYEEDNEGVLLIDNQKNQIECAVKMPLQQIEELIILCKNKVNA